MHNSSTLQETPLVPSSLERAEAAHEQQHELNSCLACGLKQCVKILPSNTFERV